MPRVRMILSGLLACVAMTCPAWGQDVGIHWQSDIEAAKVMARQSGRLVLVHVWADGCGPCAALEQNVFNQPGVAGAIETKFVPVKLNANENPATAQGFGITRVPTDVVLSPDGQVLQKLISPATPTAYVAELNVAAMQYASKSTQTPFDKAVAAAPQPALLNSAYAGLPIGATSAPISPAAPPTVAPPAPAMVPAIPAVQPAPQSANNPYAGLGSSANAATAPKPALPTLPPATSAAIAPASVPYTPAIAPPTNVAATDRYTMSNAAVNTQMPVAPVQTPTAPQQINNPAAQPQYSPITAQSAAAPAAEISPNAGVAVPDARKLPIGAPPLALEGYCPVTMRTTWKWVAGDPKWGAIHRGRTYWFSGPREQQQFLANPDSFSVALGGVDPVLAIDHQQSVAGLREHSLDYDGQFYTFSSEATLQQFTANPERYAASVRQAMGVKPGQSVR